MKHMKLDDYIFFSGGAKGADSCWESALMFYLVSPNIKVYRPADIDNLDDFEFDKLEKDYLEVVKTLKRHPIDAEEYAGKLVRRDMLQVKDAEAVYAIAPIDRNGYVKGGTGYATTRAIIMGLDVYVFDDRNWYKWDYKSNKFEIIDYLPEFRQRSCCVGSRDLSEIGRSEIHKMIKNFKNKL